MAGDKTTLPAILEFMTRLGIFGGSFNPPHHAHVMAVGVALSSGAIDRVLVIPTAEHPFGKPLAGFDDRMEMCRRAFDVFGERVEVTDIESRIPAPNYTVNTLRAIRRERADALLRLILGTDLLSEVARWKDFDEVVALAPPLWIGREGQDAPGDTIFPFRLPDVSSTEIRRRLATGDAPEGLVPAAVLDYISARGLYAGSGAPRRVLVLGLGKVGTVLSRWLAASGAIVQGWDPKTSQAELGGVDASDLVVVAAPEAALGDAASAIRLAGIPESVPAVHCSGAAPVRALADRARPVGRMHPVFPFATQNLPPEDLAGIHLVLEGDAPAIEAASAMIRDAGGVPVAVEDLDAPRYHAACVMAANFLAALGMVAEDLAVAAGLPADQAAAALMPLMEASLRNGARLGFRGSLTGPAARGDRATVDAHLAALATAPREVLDLYRAGDAVLDEWIRVAGAFGVDDRDRNG